ncbi:MAG: hypothetical protein RLY43_305 [Bacteroidota bacterium]|jgi:hypothetical protein
MNNSKVPILLIAFNRPQKTEQVLNRICEYSPEELFIFIDGPRNEEDSKKINSILNTINSLHTNFKIHIHTQDKNLGCKYGPLTAINWFFEHVDKGIILEDDCLPYLPFFDFCSHLLRTYEHDEKIMHISGNNFQNGKKRGDINASYYFSNYTHSWGWATWKRSWSLYNQAIENFYKFKKENHIQKIQIGKSAQIYWLKNFERTLAKTDSWDSLWMYTVWYHKGLAILPQQNLVENIGFDQEATHTKFDTIKQKATPVLSLEIIDPTKIEIDQEAEIYTFNSLYKTSKIKSFFLLLKQKLCR